MSLPTAARIDELRERTRAFILSRATRLGAEAGGIYGYYLAVAEDPALFRPYDLPILEAIGTELPAYDDYLEVGAGLGQLVALIALSGRRAHALESDQRRHDALVAYQTHLIMRDQPLHGRLLAIHGRFPTRLEGLDPARSLAIATNIVTDDPDVSEQGLARELRRYGGAIIDLARFRGYRGSEAQFEELQAILAGEGFPTPRIMLERRTGEIVDTRLAFYDFGYRP